MAGTAQDVTAIDAVFSVEAGDLNDAARSSQGALPVLRYTAPHTFATSGVLSEAEQRFRAGEPAAVV